jgi:hypothetical protein
MTVRQPKLRIYVNAVVRDEEHAMRILRTIRVDIAAGKSRGDDWSITLAPVTPEDGLQALTGETERAS